MNCKKCGQEIDKKAVICVNCGCKVKKPIYKKWWFWVIVVFAVIVVGGTSSGTAEETTNNSSTNASAVSQEEITYEIVELQELFDDLNSNAMKAENKYQGKYVEFKCNIVSFDSDGSYISVEPINASEWDFTSATCYIKDDTQKEFLLDKNVDDEITVRGKIKSIGELLGYSIDIKEVY